MDAATQILDELKARLGARWDDLSPADRTLIANCTADAATVAAAALAGADVTAEQAQIDAQLANLTSVGVGTAAVVASDFWAAVANAAQKILAVALKAAI